MTDAAGDAGAGAPEASRDPGAGDPEAGAGGSAAGDPGDGDREAGAGRSAAGDRDGRDAGVGDVEGLVVRSPGRVNLIGEHTDYNDGFVLPLAIEPALTLRARPHDEPVVRIRSDDADQPVVVDLAAGPRPGAGGWAAYVHGVLGVLAEDGLPLHGWEGELTSTLPIGASLSSSAALELAVARVAVAAAGRDWNPVAMARAGMRAENEWVGVSTGIMDQLACASGVADHALLIDCRSLAVTPVPLPPDVAVAILDTGTRRELVGSEYDARRRDCEEAARRLGVAALRDSSPEDVAASDLPARLRARARHVTSEDRRTVATAEALRAGDLDAVGAAMVASHASLRDDYEVSSPALDAMVEAALASPGVVGARMTGGGFGGAAVALVHADAVDDAVAETSRRYHAATAREARVIVTRATDGTAVVS